MVIEGTPRIPHKRLKKVNNMQVEVKDSLKKVFEELKAHPKSDIKNEANFEHFVNEVVMMELTMVGDNIKEGAE